MSESLPHVTFIAPDPADLAPLFPGYEIESLIATGGMGAVYQAVQKSLERAVAIKILPQEFSSDAAFCAGFEAEAKAMARLNHPNLIGVYDFGEVSGMLYIIMEYVPGKSLFHSSHGMAIDPAEVIRIVSAICAGLAHAHDNGIIHRDIKPSNILLDLNANPKIGDFGLARPADRQIQEDEEIFGTPHYTAPEVVNSPHSVDHRADIFSVGVILHELLTGRLPAEDPRPASIIVHCDPRFDSIIRRATDPAPERRYASAREIARELQMITSSAGPRVMRTNPVPGVKRPRPYKQARKADQSSGLPAFVVLLVLGALGYLVYQRLQNQKPAPPQPSIEEPGSKRPDRPVHTPDTPADQPATKTGSPPANTAPGNENAGSQSGTSPITEPNPESDAQQHSSPSEPATPKPVFDVQGFLDQRARAIMRERSQPLIRAHDSELTKNTEAFGAALQRSIRKLNHRDTREQAEENADEIIRNCRRNNNRIPTDADENLSVLSDYDEIHEEYLNKQKALDESLDEKLRSLSPTYILGIEKQIERLRPQNDTGAIQLLEEEIAKVRDDQDYFPSLMLPR